MRAIIQRVKEASVEVEGEIIGKIARGLLVLLGIHRNDSVAGVPWMIDKIINLRIFEKEEGRFDDSLLDIDGALLIVSQFTLYGDCSRGRRPSFSEAMNATDARTFFELFIEQAKEKVSQVESGIFQTSMNVSLVNEGPVTVVLDSKKEV
jgi:D-aminoacyl-tRNA deacylase